MEEKKRRKALTDADRLIIRKRNQTHAPGTQQKLIDWFTVEPRYKNIIGNHLYNLIREVFLYKGNSLFWLKKL
jgi:hypothetical protein